MESRISVDVWMSRQAMKSIERIREENRMPYYKLAQFDEMVQTFRDGKKGYTSYEGAKAAAKRPGLYRISTVTRDGRTDGEPFKVGGGKAEGPIIAKPKARAAALASRPIPRFR